MNDVKNSSERRNGKRALSTTLIAVVIVVIVAVGGIAGYFLVKRPSISPTPTTQTVTVISNASFSAGGTTAGADSFPFDWALSMGFFKKVLPNVNVQGFPGGAGDVIHALETGSIGVAYAAGSSAITAIAKGAPIVIVAFWMNTPYTTFVLVRSDSGITNITQLKNATFANSKPGSNDAIALDLVAGNMGWNISSIHRVYVGSTSGQYAAVVSGKATATVLNVWDLQFLRSGKLKPIYTNYLAWPGEVIVANRDFLASHPKDVQAFIQAMIELDRVWYGNYGNSIIQYLVSTYNYTVPQAQAFLKLSYATNLSTAAIYVSAIQNALTALRLAGAITNSSVGVSAFYNGQFVPVQPSDIPYPYKPVVLPLT